MSVNRIRVTDQIRMAASKKDPSKTYGFQTCGLYTDLGMLKEFTRLFDPSRGEKPLPAGDFEVVPNSPYIDSRGNLVLGYKFEPVAATKAS